MTFKRVLAISNTVMPLVTVVVTGFFVPRLLDWWTFHKVRRCRRSLLSYFDKVCRNLGCKYIASTFKETYFETDYDIEALIKADKERDKSVKEQGWLETGLYQHRTALNASRIKAGLESRNFYHSHHFRNNKYGELLVVLTVKNNAAEIRVFNRGDWAPPKPANLQRWLRKIGVKLFGFRHTDDSIMLV